MAKSSDPVSDSLYALETRQTITLQFNHDALQSVMRKSDPFALEFEYTQAMMSFMPLVEEPQHILLIGLGGGSLSKFCYKHYPDSLVTTVEISREVIAYRDKFMIPANNQRFKIIEADGAVYLRNKTDFCDVILLDGYNGDGLPDVLSTETFYQDCYRALRPQGILVVNLWRKDAQFRRNLARIHTCFDKKTVTIKCQSGNEIVLAFKQPMLPEFDDVWKKALLFQQQTRLNLPQFLEDMVFSLRNNWFYSGRAEN